MKKSILAIGFALCALMMVSCGGNKTRIIKVDGNGEVTYVPDMVTMTVTIKDVQPVLRDALANTKDISKKLLQLCKDYSIPDEDVKTSYSQTGREYKWQNGESVFIGFKAEQSFQITYKDLNRIEEFTGEILGLKVYSLGSFKYSHTKKSDYEAEANLLALDDAKLAAEKMAERMGLKVGKVLFISDVNTNAPMYYYEDSYEAEAENKSLSRASGFVVAPGILSSKKEVIVSFELK